MAPQHNPAFRRVWDWYLSLKYRRSFARIHFDFRACEGKLDPGIPVILVPNHISWWDGFFCFEIQRRLRPGSGIYSLMLESELRKFPVLRKLGCFGMEPRNPVSVRRAFAQFQELVAANPYRTLTYFPQGKISPVRQRPLGFQRGIELLLRMAGPAQCVPVALHIEPLTAEKPTAFVFAGNPVNSAHHELTSRFLETEVTRLLEKITITAPLDLLAGRQPCP